MKVFTFKNLRIVILLLILAYAAIYTKEQKLQSRSWYQPISVTIFPINGDGTEQTTQYIADLRVEDFSEIDTFFTKNAQKFELIANNPIVTSLGQTISAHPPPTPMGKQSVLKVMLWSLQLRYWAYRHTPDSLSNKNRIRLYVLYHQGKQNQALEHSLGLQKGLIGIVHAFADSKQNSQNAVVMTHEIFHTVGAKDKYDSVNMPHYPDGYAEPNQSPLFPQTKAEIMAGRMAISEHQAKMATSLSKVVVGTATAKEINWIKSHD